jgi:hypothetical protein
MAGILFLLVKKMNSMQNISLCIPEVSSYLNKKELLDILQDKCHLGVVEHIEILENLCINLEKPNESNRVAFVYFHHWYPTLGNTMIQEQLEEGKSVPIPSYLNTALNMCLHKNNYSIPMYSLDDFEEEENGGTIKEGSLSEEKRGEEEEWRNDDDDDDENWHFIISSMEEQQKMEEMEEELSRIMGEESFDLVDADYVSHLENQLSIFLHSTAAPITLQ